MRGTLWLSLAPNSRCILETRQEPAGNGVYWAVGVYGTPDCRLPVYRDAIQVARLMGSPETAEQWVTQIDAHWADEVVEEVRGYVSRVQSILRRLRNPPRRSAP